MAINTARKVFEVTIVRTGNNRETYWVRAETDVQARARALELDASQYDTPGNVPKVDYCNISLAGTIDAQ